ncbi:hypothetical protein CTAM01_01688 [Colletotrichum tamarilloi]|uniref:Uncharacterized protein n=1 Tax=Colletotrichum tamarilloi TaxID=1209934 RepID=A0ABQ9RP79_9PEZI|nr:uncharacterized protein CTAM01_01688 [Colletotrichum tamarilloi]KAK1509565.1 hypothetical protein CTAM01_01688 [Colletotrichum tamarilloi]
MCAAPAPRPSLCPLHDGSDRRHLVPEPAQYFATFPKTKGAEEIQIIKWYLLKGFNTLTRLGLPNTGEAFLENPSRSIRNMGARRLCSTTCRCRTSQSVNTAAAIR